MSEYRVPYEASESEFVEKRSRFISHLWRVESEAEARTRIEEMKKKHEKMKEKHPSMWICFVDLIVGLPWSTRCWTLRIWVTSTFSMRWWTRARWMR